MRSEREKGGIELQVFRDFARAANLPVDPGSIEERDPPEPDILCRHRDNGQLAFELVEICDSRLAVLKKHPERSDGFIWTSDPSSSIIENKLRKQYTTRYPVWLLCYINGRLITPDDVIVPKIVPRLESVCHVFQQVWLFSQDGAQMIWGPNTPPDAAVNGALPHTGSNQARCREIKTR